MRTEDQYVLWVKRFVIFKANVICMRWGCRWTPFCPIWRWTFHWQCISMSWNLFTIWAVC